MATFFLFGKYNADALKGVSASRTKKVTAAVEKLGGKIQSIHALMGEKDLAIIADMPGLTHALKASVELHKLTGISFSTQPAISVEDFDKLMSN
jgi:uncharacterized protein with GYD domain